MCGAVDAARGGERERAVADAVVGAVGPGGHSSFQLPQWNESFGGAVWVGVRRRSAGGCGPCADDGARPVCLAGRGRRSSAGSGPCGGEGGGRSGVPLTGRADAPLTGRADGADGTVQDLLMHGA
ncbi:hypothetical protein GCM10018793_39240 [Streptomyces sulfonofaciens]|uniref:Uncharacterized protein n=1 Tax=Streptomyces sulfonofaciens TaxID=68272 RepID=A0A919GCQ0_9ACTN|nr:hypothetical protein GCM10018793_39240 [Streptomyces sulfonofaciens]